LKVRRFVSAIALVIIISAACLRAFPAASQNHSPATLDTTLRELDRAAKGFHSLSADVERTNRFMGSSSLLWAEPLAKAGLLAKGESVVAFCDYDYPPDDPVYAMGPLAGAKTLQRKTMGEIHDPSGRKASSEESTGGRDGPSSIGRARRWRDLSMSRQTLVAMR